MSAMGLLRRCLIGVPDREALAFVQGHGPKWDHVQQGVMTAVGGYHSVLDDHRLERLVPALEEVPLELRGYAYEGAAMGLVGMDLFLPGPSRFQEYAQGPARHHHYMIHIGAGEALARLRRRPEPFLRKLQDPVVRWLVMDGYGFHEAFFRPGRHVNGQRVPAGLSHFAARVFDQGVGRGIWFLSGADVDLIARRIAGFPMHRQPDLWAGVGVACGYVGGLRRDEVERLADLAGPYRPELAVGAAFVAKGRHRAGNPVPDTDLACSVLLGVDSAEAARIVDRAWLDLPDSDQSPAYDTLQRRLAAGFWDMSAEGVSTRRRLAVAP